MTLPEKPKGNLRTGFTTGTSAAAASVAAVLSIINQKKTESVDVLLPKKSRITININSCEFEKNKARCSVIKDAGDDPDVTHGAEIVVDLELTPNPNSIEIDGGEGVGRVTKPGIGLDIGQAAINPTPRKMIIENLTEVGKEILKFKIGARIHVEIYGNGIIENAEKIGTVTVLTIHFDDFEGPMRKTLNLNEMKIVDSTD